MYIGDVEIGKEYILNYDKPKIVKVLNCDAVGDCTIQFKNNKKDVYHCSLLEEIKEQIAVFNSKIGGKYERMAYYLYGRDCVY